MTCKWYRSSCINLDQKTNELISPNVEPAPLIPPSSLSQRSREESHMILYVHKTQLIKSDLHPVYSPTPILPALPVSVTSPCVCLYPYQGVLGVSSIEI